MYIFTILCVRRHTLGYCSQTFESIRLVLIKKYDAFFHFSLSIFLLPSSYLSSFSPLQTPFSAPPFLLSPFSLPLSLSPCSPKPYANGKRTWAKGGTSCYTRCNEFNCVMNINRLYMCAISIAAICLLLHNHFYVLNTRSNTRCNVCRNGCS